MKLIVCLDENKGMMFNKRRQSRDKILINDILELCKGNTLYTNDYSSRLFPENSVIITSNYAEISENDFYFAENSLPTENIGEVIVYKWNRVYPADTFFDIDLRGYSLVETKDFEGSSHEKITREIYKR